MFNNFGVDDTSLLAVVGVIVAALKALGISGKWLPLFSLLTGGLIGLIGVLTNGIPLWPALVGGILMGAATSGLYDFGTKTLLGRK